MKMINKSKAIVVTNKFEQISKELTSEFFKERVVSPYANVHSEDPKVYAIYTKLQELLSLLSEMVEEEDN